MYVASRSGCVSGVAGSLRWALETKNGAKTTQAYFYVSFCALDLKPYMMGIGISDKKKGAKEFYHR